MSDQLRRMAALPASGTRVSNSIISSILCSPALPRRSQKPLSEPDQPNHPRIRQSMVCKQCRVRRSLHYPLALGLGLKGQPICSIGNKAHRWFHKNGNVSEHIINDHPHFVASHWRHRPSPEAEGLFGQGSGLLLRFKSNLKFPTYRSILKPPPSPSS